ncbi:MAG: cupin domain-containing protein [Candidatus Caenarcaniphilales bacterium]|nr:cupin domain-containing protein [Candidatus Caenarcaniphilales bacterium]
MEQVSTEKSAQVKVVQGGNSLSPVNMTGATDCLMQELLTETNGASNFAMRLFEVAPGGHTPQHSHPWEHEIYVLEGEGELRGESLHPFKQGDAMLVPPGTLHQFYNSGAKPLRFLCLIPNQANYPK